MELQVTINLDPEEERVLAAFQSHWTRKHKIPITIEEAAAQVVYAFLKMSIDLEKASQSHRHN